MLMPQIIKNFFICIGLFYRNHKFNSWRWFFSSNLKLLRRFSLFLQTHSSASMKKTINVLQNRVEIHFFKILHLVLRLINCTFFQKWRRKLVEKNNFKEAQKKMYAAFFEINSLFLHCEGPKRSVVSLVSFFLMIRTWWCLAITKREACCYQLYLQCFPSTGTRYLAVNQLRKLNHFNLLCDGLIST